MCWATVVQWTESTSLDSFGWRKVGRAGHSGNCGARCKRTRISREPKNRFSCATRPPRKQEQDTGMKQLLSLSQGLHGGPCLVVFLWTGFFCFNLQDLSCVALTASLEEFLNFLGEVSGHTSHHSLASPCALPLNQGL